MTTHLMRVGKFARRHGADLRTFARDDWTGKIKLDRTGRPFYADVGYDREHHELCEKVLAHYPRHNLRNEYRGHFYQRQINEWCDMQLRKYDWFRYGPTIWVTHESQLAMILLRWG